MSKLIKRLCFCILCLVILLNIFVSSYDIIEGAEDRKKEKKVDKGEKTDFCLKAALLAQKNENSLKKLSDKINELFDKRMKDLKLKCSNAAKAINKKHPPGYN